MMIILMIVQPIVWVYGVGKIVKMIVVFVVVLKIMY